MALKTIIFLSLAVLVLVSISNCMGEPSNSNDPRLQEKRTQLRVRMSKDEAIQYLNLIHEYLAIRGRARYGRDIYEEEFEPKQQMSRWLANYLRAKTY